MEKRKRRRFTAEYKAEAVKRLDESGKGLQQAADELGVHANQLRGWRNEPLAIGSAEALARQSACWTACSTWCAPAASGATCRRPRPSRPGARSTATCGPS